MATNIGIKFNTDWEGIPPHMSREDFIIWDKWRSEATKGAVSLYFDIGLGAGKVPEEILDQKTIDMWIKLNQKRADVIIEYLTEIKIVELRHNASLNTIGRLSGYGLLYNDDPVFKKTVKLTIVTDLLDADVKRTAETFGIEYIVV